MTHETPNSSDHTDSHPAEPHVHIVSPGLLIAVFAGLMVLTILTVTVSYAESSMLIHLGWLISLLFPLVGLAALVCMVIAGIKANNGEDYKYPFSLELVK